MWVAGVACGLVADCKGSPVVQGVMFCLFTACQRSVLTIIAGHGTLFNLIGGMVVYEHADIESLKTLWGPPPVFVARTQSKWLSRVRHEGLTVPVAQHGHWKSKSKKRRQNPKP